MDGKNVLPDDQEATITRAEYRIRVTIQKEVDDNLRSEKEDKATRNEITTLLSDVLRSSTDVVCMKNTRAQWPSTGSSTGNFTARVVPNTFVASRIQLKGWGVWGDIRGTGITMDEARQLFSDAKCRIKPEDRDKFDGKWTDWDQGHFDIKMMTFLWFDERVTSMVRKLSHANIPLEIKMYP